MDSPKNEGSKTSWYTRWHEHPHSSLAHWTLFLILVSLITWNISSSIAKVYNSSDAEAEMALLENQVPNLSLSQYTAELLNLINALKVAPPGQKAELAKAIGEFARLRRSAIENAIKTSPDKVLQSALPQEALAALPPEVRHFVEERKQVRGKFEWIIEEDEEQERAENIFAVTDSATGKRYRVYFKGEPSAQTDDTVAISGVILGDDMATTQNDIQVTEIVSPTPLQKKVAVILFNFKNDLRTSFTVDQARGIYFTNTNSVNKFYKENSFGKIELVGSLRPDGDVFGWVTIPYDNINCSSMYHTWGAAAKAEAAKQGFVDSKYTNVAFVFPAVSCPFTGAANVGGSYGYSYINTTSQGTITHELGHNFGSYHASSWSCIESGIRVSVSIDTNCTRSEYGDPFMVMGQSSSLKHFSGYAKGLASINWFAPANVLAINRSTNSLGTYTIAPIEQASAGVQSLKVTRTSGTSPTYYYVEFRQPYGFDNFASTNPVVNGVTIRIAPDGATQSKLVDTTPSTTSFADASLAVGQTFTDSYNGVSITTLSVSPSGASVRVNYAELPCIRANPSIALFPTSASLFAGQSASVNYTLTNNDSVSCSSSSLTLSPSMPTGWSMSPASISHSLAGGASASGSFIISTSASAVGSNNVTLTATNSASGNKSTANLSVTILAPDSTPPVVNITKPVNGSSVTAKGKLQISATAFDSSGIAQIVVSLDGKMLSTCYSATCSVNISANTLSLGTHTISAVATDKAAVPSSSSATSTFTVNKR